VNTSSHSIQIRSNGRQIVATEDFPVMHGDITLLFGESGIGKSLLCKALYGLIDPDELQVTIDGHSYAAHLDNPLTKEIQANSFFVFQEPSSHLNPLMRITEQLGEGSLAQAQDQHQVMRQLWQSSDDPAIRKILELYPKPYRPSGGEKQRILLAMAFQKIDLMLKAGLAGKPTFFVFDEPTGSLDNYYRNLFLYLLFEKYARSPFTIMLITHDYSMISEIYARYRALLGRIHFKELSQCGKGRVQVHDFSTEEYLHWLQQTRPAPVAQSAAATAPVLQVEAEFKVFGRSHRICSDPGRSRPVPLTIRPGELVYIKAASGVGKTTLAKVIMGLYEAQSFKMSLGGMQVTERTAKSIWASRIWGRKAGMVFQHADEALDLSSRVRELFRGLPLKNALHTPEIKATLSHLFDSDEITDGFLARKLRFLSGGQKQRLNLIRSLTLNTDLIILDEPLNGLDFTGVKRVLALLERKRAEGSALLLISHNEEIFDALVDPRCVYYLS
jgi:peptide/nickel transport system ATP-binding protein